MTENKNMLKTKNNRADMKTVAKKKFYGIMEYKETVYDEKGEKKVISKTGVVAAEDKMTRLQAKKEIERAVKSSGGKLVYFGAFKN